MDRHKYSEKGPTSSLYTSFDSSLNHKGKAKCIRYNTNFRKKIKLSHSYEPGPLGNGSTIDP